MRTPKAAQFAATFRDENRGSGNKRERVVKVDELLGAMLVSFQPGSSGFVNLDQHVLVSCSPMSMTGQAESAQTKIKTSAVNWPPRLRKQVAAINPTNATAIHRPAAD